MNNCAGPPRSKTASPRGYFSLHRPTIVAPGASYEVELPSIDAEFSVVAEVTGWRSAASTFRHKRLAGRPPIACVTFFERLQHEILSAERIRTRLTHTNSSPTNPGWFNVYR